MSDIELRPFPPYPPPKERVGQGIMTRVARFSWERADALEDRLRLAVELLGDAEGEFDADGLYVTEWREDLARLRASLPPELKP